MKHLLIILALFVGNSFTEDKFPIELTCETSQGIIYFSINDSPEKTWMVLHSSPMDLNNFSFKDFLDKRVLAHKRKNRFEISDDIIYLTFLYRLTEVYVYISRLTGDIKFGPWENGKCFKGFKEYKEKKF